MSGSNFECPICGQTARAFPAWTNDIEGSTVCPGCSSHDRHRLLWLFFERQRNQWLDQDLRVLHTSPHSSLERVFRSRSNWSYVTSDLDSDAMNLKIDLRSVPFPPDQFDLVISYHVIQDIHEDRRALEELHRVLLPGGRAFIKCIVDHERETSRDVSGLSEQERFERFGYRPLVWEYGRDYLDRLESAGFQVETIMPHEFLTPGEIDRFKLEAADRLYVGSKT